MEQNGDTIVVSSSFSSKGGRPRLTRFGSQESNVPVDGKGGEKQRTGKAAKPNSIRVTTPYMTKYERARVLGTRALQIR